MGYGASPARPVRRAGRATLRPLPVVLAVRDFLALFEHVFFRLVVGDAGWRRGLLAILGVVVGILVVGVLVLGVVVGAGCHGCEATRGWPGRSARAARPGGPPAPRCRSGRTPPGSRCGRRKGRTRPGPRRIRRRRRGSTGCWPWPPAAVRSAARMSRSRSP